MKKENLTKQLPETRIVFHSDYNVVEVHKPYEILEDEMKRHHKYLADHFGKEVLVLFNIVFIPKEWRDKLED